jgi:hypothetical protein
VFTANKRQGTVGFNGPEELKEHIIPNEYKDFKTVIPKIKATVL